jgi:hypothetical protein
VAAGCELVRPAGNFVSLLHSYFPSCTRNPQSSAFSRLSVARRFNIVATNQAHAFRIPLSRQCAMTLRDKADQAAPATWPAAAIFGVHPSALQIARVGTRRRSGQFEFRMRLVRTIRRDPRARSSPVRTATDARCASRTGARLPGCSSRAAKAMPASSDAGAVPLSATRGGWTAGRTAFFVRFCGYLTTKIPAENLSVFSA